ncbi:hypothetical protein ACFX2I_028349 [Malus domestica]
MSYFKLTGSVGGEDFVITSNTKDLIVVCFNKTISPTGLWRAHNPFMSALSVLVIRLSIAVFSTRIFMIALKPLHQPRIVAEILGGMSSSTSTWGRVVPAVFPYSTVKIIETIGNLALVYHMFLVGLELDLKPVLRAGKKALSIALAGIVFSVLVGWALCRYVLLKDFVEETKGKDGQKLPTVNGPWFWGVALATTNFPDLARILTDLKLLYSAVGGLALSASVISDLCSWFLLLLVMAIVNNFQTISVGLTLLFIGLCIFIVRPLLSRIVDRIRDKVQDDGDYGQLECFVLAGVVLCGYITDACGSHSIVGSFMLGAIMPRGEFSNNLKKKVGSFVPGILLPLYFCINGSRINYVDILSSVYPSEKKTGTDIYRVGGVIILAFAAKTLSTLVAGLVNKMSFRDSLALGVLMNTKGLLTLIILNTGREVKALNKQTFGVMVLAIWVMTFVVGPLLAIFYKSSARPFVQYKERNVVSVGSNNELRILACAHNSRNVPGIINLLEASNPTNKSPLHVLAVHLVELTGHTSAMLVVHDACKTNDVYSPDNSSPSNAFEAYAQQRECVTMQTLTAVSQYSTMHQDICNLAEENRVAIIIIPFHNKSTTLVGGVAPDANNSHLKSLNNNLIANARCSVGVFVDRGLGASNDSYRRCCYSMLFFGGVDDREALAYAGRMAGHPRTSLTVISFNIMSKNASNLCSEDDHGDDDDEDDDDEDGTGGILKAMASTGREKKLDELYLDEFRLMSMNDASIKLLEKSVTRWEQILSLISSMEGEYDMYIVGRRHGNISEVTTTLLDGIDSNDLGFLGDALVSSNLTASTSVLVVQQGRLLDYYS